MPPLALQLQPPPEDIDIDASRRRRRDAQHHHDGHHLQQQRGRRKAMDPHRQQPYHGLSSSNVTRHLNKIPPSHAFHPTLRSLPPPSFHRKASSVTAHSESVVRPSISRHPRTATDADVYYGRCASNVTEHLRYIPPSHLGRDVDSKPSPYFGRLATSVTDPSKFQDLPPDRDVDFLQQHHLAPPASARLPVPPQNVSKEVLFHALSARGPSTQDYASRKQRSSNELAEILKHCFQPKLIVADRAADPTATSDNLQVAKNCMRNTTTTTHAPPPYAAAVQDHIPIHNIDSKLSPARPTATADLDREVSVSASAITSADVSQEITTATSSTTPAPCRKGGRREQAQQAKPSQIERESADCSCRNCAAAVNRVVINPQQQRAAMITKGNSSTAAAAGVVADQRCNRSLTLAGPPPQRRPHTSSSSGIRNINYSGAAAAAAADYDRRRPSTARTQRAGDVVENGIHHQQPCRQPAAHGHGSHRPVTAAGRIGGGAGHQSASCCSLNNMPEYSHETTGGRGAAAVAAGTTLNMGSTADVHGVDAAAAAGEAPLLVCDEDDSSQASTVLGSEKLEFVTKWIEQRSNDFDDLGSAAALPYTSRYPPSNSSSSQYGGNTTHRRRHSRRSSSVTKFGSR